MRFLFLACFVSMVVMRVTVAQSISTTLQLDAPNDPINVINLGLAAGLLGNDSQSAILSGTTEATFDLTPNGSGYDVTGLTLTGGTTSISDVTFNLGFGISAVATGLSGTPFTTTPPGTVTGGSFSADEHGLTVDQGTVVAAGNTIDFAIDPFVGNGAGTGTIVTTMGTPVAGFDVLDVVLELPVMFDEPFDIPGVPFLGTVTANFSGTGTLKASGTLQIPLNSPLACDFDADGNCDLDDIDEMYAAIAAGTSGGQFDYDTDGTVTHLDIPGWLADASDASNGALLDPGNDVLKRGDIDLNGDVNSSDLGGLLANFGSAAGPGWGGGDLNADLVVDSSDLGQLLAEFGHTSLAVSTVPEPTSQFLAMFICGWLVLARQRRR